MSDIKVKCCRCRNQHQESDRKPVADKVIRGAEALVCPKCACTTYYDMTPTIAFAWASGLLEFGEALPDGAIQVAAGPKSELKGVVMALARQGQGNSEGKLIVPGIPEAPDQTAAGDALEAWITWCAKHNGKRHRYGVVFGAKS